ncbi:histone deacetylase family protein [Fodinicurvata fenggangensis]|uniref:histone deacetylase family protein n=1 Tax=Fodinicurvata fenggangensis TaxID=1121830 RepID=UPI00047E8147|nr:histone deacetylase family protein [Fodinicurvata fenggangensis]
MKVVFNEAQKRHYPRNFLVSGAQQPNPEVPERAERLLAAALDSGLEQVTPPDYGLSAVSAVHTPEYLDFLEHVYERWQRIEGASEEVVPNIHPNYRDGRYPHSVVGQAGYHMADTACPISGETWQAALWSAHSATHAARLVQEGAPAAYALSRPPGHHAYADMAGGFCFLNNSGVAASELRRSHARVAIVDVDVHHGNGTQGMFYKRDDVLTVSIHADPVRFYPFFWGHADERGEGPGLGYNFNLPLPRGMADDDYLPVLDRALQRVRAFAPGAIVVALGLDAYEGDPLAGLRISTPGFARIGERLAKLDLPSVVVQEGGYLSDELGLNLSSFLDGFTNAHKV